MYTSLLDQQNQHTVARTQSTQTNPKSLKTQLLKQLETEMTYILLSEKCFLTPADLIHALNYKRQTTQFNTNAGKTLEEQNLWVKSPLPSNLIELIKNTDKKKRLFLLEHSLYIPTTDTDQTSINHPSETNPNKNFLDALASSVAFQEALTSSVSSDEEIEQTQISLSYFLTDDLDDGRDSDETITYSNKMKHKIFLYINVYCAASLLTAISLYAITQFVIYGILYALFLKQCTAVDTLHPYISDGNLLQRPLYISCSNQFNPSKPLEEQAVSLGCEFSFTTSNKTNASITPLEHYIDRRYPGCFVVTWIPPSTEEIYVYADTPMKDHNFIIKVGPNTNGCRYLTKKYFSALHGCADFGPCVWTMPKLENPKIGGVISASSIAIFQNDKQVGSCTFYNHTHELVCITSNNNPFKPTFDPTRSLRAKFSIEGFPHTKTTENLPLWNNKPYCQYELPAPNDLGCPSLGIEAQKPCTNRGLCVWQIKKKGETWDSETRDHASLDSAEFQLYQDQKVAGNCTVREDRLTVFCEMENFNPKKPSDAIVYVTAENRRYNQRKPACLFRFPKPGLKDDIESNHNATDVIYEKFAPYN